MPELPEVETTRRAIAQAALNREVNRAVVRVPALRWAIPPNLAQTLQGKTLTRCERRGKYVLMFFASEKESGVLLLHLGMSGALLQLPLDAPLKKHDHFDLIFDAFILRLNDPRRFGALLWLAESELATHPLLAHLGLEPFSAAFTPDYFFAATRGKTTPIKTLLLSGKVVVGVGNIYCSETLFLAGIHPATPAGKVSKPRLVKLHAAILHVLAAAIEAGGTTLKNFASGEHSAGAFQIQLNAYGRAGEPCKVCAAPIKLWLDKTGKAVGGRATYFCPHCQKR